MVFQTEFQFTLPKGFVDESGNLHREGVMRLATAGDEILPLKDPRVQQNPAYATIIVLSRVITRLGDLKTVTTKTVEDLFASDLAYLQTFYNKINGDGTTKIKAVCPNCKTAFELELGCPGE
jgi:hypothetical protein